MPSGSRVTAEAVVDGETLRSQEFTVPSAGGVRVALVAGIAKAAAAEAAARAEAAKAPARPGTVVFGPDTRVILEFQDDRPTVFYLFSVVNNARTPVDTGRPLVLDLPAQAESASLVSGPATIARMQDRRLTLTGPFPPGPTAFQVAYRLPLTSTLRIEQAWPAAVEGALVAAEKVGGLTMRSPQLTASREGESNGEVFVMGTAGRLAEGQPLTLEFTGVPAAARLAAERGAGTGSAAGGVGGLGGVARGPRRQVGAGRPGQGTRASARRHRRHRRRAPRPRWRRPARRRQARAARGRGRAGVRRARSAARRYGNRGVSADFDRVAAVQVGRHYGRRRALADISFTATRRRHPRPAGAERGGEVHAAGHPRHAAGGVDRPGRVRRGRRATGDAAAVRARIGMLGHDLFLYPELTALENLVFFGRLYGVSEAPRRAGEALERAGLSARAGDAVSALSRGMRQRVALERALLHQPRLLLLDEPFTGLDQASAAALVGRLREEQQRGVVTVLATHDLDVVDGLLTSTLFLRNGRQVEPAGAGGLRDRYREAMQSA